jgi:hypothetical protein
MILVVIRMTAETAFLGELGEIILHTAFALGSVAFFAGYLSVFADQGIAGLPFVIEFGVFPAHIVMASATLFVGEFFREKVDIVLFVALFTRRAQAKKVGVVFPGFLVVTLFDMTLGASDLGVGTMEIEARFAMVEPLFVDTGGVVSTTLMIVMTGDTGAFGQAVKGMPLLDGLFDLHVTGEAFAVRHPLASVVAL